MKLSAAVIFVGYYSKKCKGVENVVKWHVIRANKANRRTGAALVHLFHGCFIRASTKQAVSSKGMGAEELDLG
jgi:hypothetical protein